MQWQVIRCPFTSDCEVIMDVGEFREVARVRGFTPIVALSRACLIATAPELHYALSEMIAVAKKELPDHVWEKLKHHEKTLERAGELYEQHRRPSEKG